MFKQIEKEIDTFFDKAVPGKRIKITPESRMLALKLFFRIYKQFDPEKCFVDLHSIRAIRVYFHQKYKGNPTIQYLLKLLRYAYATPIENHTIGKIPLSDLLSKIKEGNHE